MHPLYGAIREYLEIDPRIKVLNERCRVFLDLAEILSDSVADAKMSYITWIVIILIMVSILVTLTEVGLRFAMLSKDRKGGAQPGDLMKARMPSLSLAAPNIIPLSTSTQPVTVADGPPQQQQQRLLQSEQMQMSDLEILALTLGLQGNATLEDVRNGIWNLKRDADSSALGDSHLPMGAPAGK